MSKIVTRLWGLYYVFLFKCARVAFRIIRPRIRGTMVAIWHRGQILLVQSSYRRGWSLPGGLAKKGETLAQAAVRETFEEVGVRLNEADLVYISENQGDLSPRDLSHLFEVTIEQPVEVTADGREIIRAEFATLEHALKRRLNANLRSYLASREKGL